MPIHAHTDHPIATTAEDSDVGWMSAVLSSPTPRAPSITCAPISPDDGVLFGLAPEPPSSSFRLQVLRAWIAARGDCPDKVAGLA